MTAWLDKAHGFVLRRPQGRGHQGGQRIFVFDKGCLSLYTPPDCPGQIASRVYS